MMKYLKHALICSFLLAFSSASSFGAETMRIAVEGAYPPFSQTEKDGSVTGYDVDIASALCVEMEVNCVFIKTEWDDLLQGLRDGKYDAIVASMSITPERLKQADFTTPYYKNEVQFIASRKMDLDTTHLEGKRIGVQSGTTAEEWLSRHAKGAEIHAFTSFDAIQPELLSGRLDAVLADRFAQWNWLMEDEGLNFEFKGKPVFDDDLIGIAVAKGNRALLERLNNALIDISENGEHEMINDSYFPFALNK